eukprot:CAMPEP_0173381732 /NCGR_PEP_ID=MMETSP1356-20130122/4141_1 /TAXON_ID=77927 ORGANISM="Hemiselmis virescens, Strain PCC157" /NCGR_SAMPLE_ID=MMETSP1356 /ASSEMBLY_ACC=CAM_ASM_000847 /LENGTH=62 /DNA_ID=CAMNT_0014335697 /DNA_START=149 /DNA_END=333 /DNA_ORIENTATION=+
MGPLTLQGSAQRDEAPLLMHVALVQRLELLLYHGSDPLQLLPPRQMILLHLEPLRPLKLVVA